MNDFWINKHKFEILVYLVQKWIISKWFSPLSGSNKNRGLITNFDLWNIKKIHCGIGFHFDLSKLFQLPHLHWDSYVYTFVARSFLLSWWFIMSNSTSCIVDVIHLVYSDLYHEILNNPVSFVGVNFSKSWRKRTWIFSSTIHLRRLALQFIA